MYRQNGQFHVEPSGSYGYHYAMINANYTSWRRHMNYTELSHAIIFVSALLENNHLKS
jgi:hypothetical protein